LSFPIAMHLRLFHNKAAFVSFQCNSTGQIIIFNFCHLFISNGI